MKRKTKISVVFLILTFSIFSFLPFSNEVYANTDIQINDDTKSEINDLIQKYNEISLLINHYEGVVEYVEDIQYCVPIQTKMVEIENVPTYYNFGSCYRITDEKYSSIEDIERLYYEVYTEKAAKIYLDSELHTSVPAYIEWDGFLYSAYDFTDSTPLCQRYIDVETVELIMGTKGIVVHAKASSRIADGVFSEADSNIKLLIVPENGKLRIERVRAVLFSMESGDVSIEERIIDEVNKEVLLKKLCAGEYDGMIESDDKKFSIANRESFGYAQNDLFFQASDDLSYVGIYDMCFACVFEENEDNIFSYLAEGSRFFNTQILNAYISQHEYVVPRIVEFSGKLYLTDYDHTIMERHDLSKYFISYTGVYYYLYIPYTYIHYDNERTRVDVFKAVDLFGDGELMPCLIKTYIDKDIHWNEINELGELR